MWTTTPWTLPANVAAGRRPRGSTTSRSPPAPGYRPGWMEGRVEAVFGKSARGRQDGRRAPSWSGRPLRRPVRPPGRAGGRRAPDRRVGQWSAPTRAPASSTSRPAAARRTSTSAASWGLPCSCRSTTPARSTSRTAGCTASTPPTPASRSRGTSAQRGRLLPRRGAGPTATRPAGAAAPSSSSGSSTSGSSRPTACASRMIEANREVEWTPDFYGKRMEDWLRNMGDWCISRKRYWGLPLPFYRAPSGKVTVVGSVAELRERAVDPSLVDGLKELHRRGSTRSRSAPTTARSRSAWPRSATAGSTRASSRSRRSAGDATRTSPRGYARGAGDGLTRADLPDHAYWEKWFPADWVSEMREQIRLWFYSQLFMSVGAGRQGAVQEGARVREGARRDRGARCTSRGATRSGSTTPSTRWAPT